MKLKVNVFMIALCALLTLSACGKGEQEPNVAKKEETSTPTEEVKEDKESSDENTKPTEIKRYGLGETLTVSENGVDLYEITFNKAFLTDERNQFSEDTSENVVVLEYTYKNLSVEDGLNIFDGSDYRIYDASGAALSTYPAGADLYGGAVSVGRSGTSQEAFGFNGDAHQTLEIEIYTSTFDSKPLAIVEVQPE